MDLAEHTPRDETRHWAVTAARAADSKQGDDVVVLEVGEVLALCGWFVIASAANERQVKAICDEVDLQIHETGGPKPKRIEGLQDRLWVLMDYGDVVIHVFQQDQRILRPRAPVVRRPEGRLVGTRRLKCLRPAEAGLRVG